MRAGGGADGRLAGSERRLGPGRRSMRPGRRPRRAGVGWAAVPKDLPFLPPVPPVIAVMGAFYREYYRG